MTEIQTESEQSHLMSCLEVVHSLLILKIYAVSKRLRSFVFEIARF